MLCMQLRRLYNKIYNINLKKIVELGGHSGIKNYMEFSFGSNSKGEREMLFAQG